MGRTTAETGFDRAAKHRLHGVVERSLQVGQGDIGIHAEPFELMEYGRVGGIGRVVAVYLAGTNHAHRRPQALHGANLHRRGVGAQQQAVALRSPLLSGDEQRVLRIARRMVGRKVQRLKIVVVAFDLRPFGNGITHGDEDRDDLIHRAQHRMPHAQLAMNAGQGYVDALGRLELLCLAAPASCSDCVPSVAAAIVLLATLLP